MLSVCAGPLHDRPRPAWLSRQYAVAPQHMVEVACQGLLKLLCTFVAAELHATPRLLRQVLCPTDGRPVQTIAATSMMLVRGQVLYSQSKQGTVQRQPHTFHDAAAPRAAHACKHVASPGCRNLAPQTQFSLSHLPLAAMQGINPCRTILCFAIFAQAAALCKAFADAPLTDPCMPCRATVPASMTPVT